MSYNILHHWPVNLLTKLSIKLSAGLLHLPETLREYEPAEDFQVGIAFSKSAALAPPISTSLSLYYNKRTFINTPTTFYSMFKPWKYQYFNIREYLNK